MLACERPAPSAQLARHDVRLHLPVTGRLETYLRLRPQTRVGKPAPRFLQSLTKASDALYQKR